MKRTKNGGLDAVDFAVSSSKQDVTFGKTDAGCSLGFGNNDGVLADVLGWTKVVCVLLTGILFVLVLNLFVVLTKH